MDIRLERFDDVDEEAGYAYRGFRYSIDLPYVQVAGKRYDDEDHASVWFQVAGGLVESVPARPDMDEAFSLVAATFNVATLRDMRGKVLWRKGKVL